MKDGTPETFTNTEIGCEAIVTHGNDRHEARVIFRDIENDSTLSVLFSTWETCLKKAKDFTKN